MAEAAENLIEEEVGSTGADLELVENEPENLQSYIAKEYADHKNTEGFRHDILTMVSGGKYRAVLAEIEAFREEKKNKMPFFEVKSSRYFRYIIQLIEAIEEHKTIPNFDQLPAGQQKKVHEQVFGYFDELNNTLKRVEKVIHDLKVQDVRSTIWVLKTFSFCVAVILSVSAVVEAYTFLGNPFRVLVQHFEGIFFQ